MGILSDLGSQFTSDLMLQEIFSLLSVTLNFNTSPYRAQTNGMADRFRGELRTMLHFMTERLWHFMADRFRGELRTMLHLMTERLWHFMADRFRGELRTMLRFMTVKDPPTGASSLHPSPSLCVSGIVQR